MRCLSRGYVSPWWQRRVLCFCCGTHMRLLRALRTRSNDCVDEIGRAGGVLCVAVSRLQLVTPPLPVVSCSTFSPCVSSSPSFSHLPVPPSGLVGVATLTVLPRSVVAVAKFRGVVGAVILTYNVLGSVILASKLSACSFPYISHLTLPHLLLPISTVPLSGVVVSVRLPSPTMACSWWLISPAQHANTHQRGGGHTRSRPGVAATRVSVCVCVCACVLSGCSFVLECVLCE